MERAVEQEPDAFFKEAITFAVYYIGDVRSLQGAIENAIKASGATGAELLRKFVIAPGAILIISNQHPYTVDFSMRALMQAALELTAEN